MRRALGIPVIANGDIWNLDDFRRCRDETGCNHFMVGRSALADPCLSHQIAFELGLTNVAPPTGCDWVVLMRSLVDFTEAYASFVPLRTLLRIQAVAEAGGEPWGDFRHFDAIKQANSLEEFFDGLEGGRGRKPASASRTQVRRMKRVDNIVDKRLLYKHA